MTVKGVAIVAIIAVFALFVLQNTQVVQVRFLIWSTEASRALVLLATFAFGVIAGALWVWRRKSKTSPEPEEGT